MVRARMRWAIRTASPPGVFARWRSSRIWPFRLAKTLSITCREEASARSLLAARIARDRELGAISQPNTARVEPACELLLHARDQLDERPQTPVVLRLIRPMRKPAWQQPLDQAEELAVGADPDRRLADRERDQLRVARQRRPTLPGRDPILVREHLRCNNKGFQIRHLELLSRGDVWKPFFVKRRVPG